MAAPKGNNLNPNGRPKKEIDWTLFEQLCAVQCTQTEIASMLKVDPDTLRTRAKDYYSDDYSVIYKKYSESGKCSLRRNQFVLSKTNATMAIWLGKQWLGQVDTPTEVSVHPETISKFNELMAQLGSLQASKSLRKMDDSKIISEQKS